jgi:hypothetical protein
MTPDEAGLRAALTGSWQLERWIIEYSGTRQSEPFSGDAAGLLVYAGDGWMSVAIQRRTRDRLPLPARSPPSREIQAAQFASYMHYAGRWRMDGGDVLHEISFALHPGLIGTTQRRHVVLAGPTLELTGDEVFDTAGSVRRHRVLWKRAS